MVISERVQEVRGNGYFKRAWDGYRDLVFAAASNYERPRILEVGGGRLPTFAEDEVLRLGAGYTVNDIEEEELRRAPGWAGRLHGDIASPTLLVGDEHTNGYDLVFSHMVFEHVARPEQAYRNIARLLAPGGTLINFMPTLFAFPFVVNKLMPERLSREVLRKLFPKRDLGEAPKFPAHYKWCNSSRRLERKILEQGFRRVEITPFYGHDYFVQLPPLQRLEDAWWPVADRLNLRLASTYAFVCCEGQET